MPEPTNPRPGGDGVAMFTHLAFERATITLAPENGGIRIVINGPTPGARLTVVVHELERLILPPE